MMEVIVMMLINIKRTFLLYDLYHTYCKSQGDTEEAKKHTQHILFTVIWRQTYGKEPLR